MQQELSVNRFNELMLRSKNLNDPLNYFLDMYEAGLINNQSVNGYTKQLKLINRAIEQTIGKYLNCEINIIRTMLQQTTDGEIIHGICFFAELSEQATLIYSIKTKIAIFALVVDQEPELWRASIALHPLLSRILGEEKVH